MQRANDCVRIPLPRHVECHETDIPIVDLVDEACGGGETRDLILSKEGPGRIYYRSGLGYVPVDLEHSVG